MNPKRRVENTVTIEELEALKYISIYRERERGDARVHLEHVPTVVPVYCIREYLREKSVNFDGTLESLCDKGLIERRRNIRVAVPIGMIQNSKAAGFESDVYRCTKKGLQVYKKIAEQREGESKESYGQAINASQREWTIPSIIPKGPLSVHEMGMYFT